MPWRASLPGERSATASRKLRATPPLRHGIMVFTTFVTRSDLKWLWSIITCKEAPLLTQRLSVSAAGQADGDVSPLATLRSLAGNEAFVRKLRAPLGSGARSFTTRAAPDPPRSRQRSIAPSRIVVQAATALHSAACDGFAPTVMGDIEVPGSVREAEPSQSTLTVMAPAIELSGTSSRPYTPNGLTKVENSAPQPAESAAPRPSGSTSEAVPAAAIHSAQEPRPAGDLVASVEGREVPE
jgi:hypothetical protein